MASGGSFNDATIDAIDAQLMAQYSLDEAAGNARVQGSVNAGALGNLAEVGGTIAAVAGIRNNCADFERNDNRGLAVTAGVDELLPGATKVLVSFWAKPESLADWRFMIVDQISANGGRLSIFSMANGSINIYADATNYQTAGSVLPVGTLKHVVIWIDTVANYISIWVNGVQIADEVAFAAGTFSGTAAYKFCLGKNSGGDGTYNFDGLIDEVSCWVDPTLTDAQAGAIASALYNSGTGRFWNNDVTPPAVPDKPVRYRGQDGDDAWHTMSSWRAPTDADLDHCEFGRALDSAASTPTHILEDDGDGTCSWIATGSSVDPMRFGASKDIRPLPGESDRFQGFGDPDQTDDDCSFFVRSVDVLGNASAWAKLVDGTAAGGGGAPVVGSSVVRGI